MACVHLNGLSAFSGGPSLTLLAWPGVNPIWKLSVEPSFENIEIVGSFYPRMEAIYFVHKWENVEPWIWIVPYECLI